MNLGTRSPSRMFIVAVLSVAGLSACGDDGGSGDPEGFAFEAARVCSDAINDVDIDVAIAGSEANFALLEAAVSDEPVAAAHADALDAYREEFVAIRDDLAAIEPGDEGERDAWNEVIGSLDSRIDLMERRADLARDADGSSIDVDAFEPGGPEESAGLEGAITELELVGRDCEFVAAWEPLPGSAELAEFLAEGASACTTIVSRRRAEGYSSQRVLETVAQVYEGEEVEITTDLEDELDALADEWDQTLADLEAVDADEVPDDVDWQSVVDAAAERADVFGQRAEAVANEDLDAIAELFAPGVWEYPGFDWEAVGLARRDCRSIEA